MADRLITAARTWTTRFPYSRSKEGSGETSEPFFLSGVTRRVTVGSIDSALPAAPLFLNRKGEKDGA